QIIDASIVGRIVESQFPELTPVTAAYVGEGYDSIAFDVNGEWVFRFPKRADVEQQLQLELRVLPLLAPRVRLPLPSFRFQGRPSTLFARSFAGYRKLPGVPGISVAFGDRLPPEIARQMGRFLSALHACPIELAAAEGVPRQSLRALVDELRHDALDDIDRV